MNSVSKRKYMSGFLNISGIILIITIFSISKSKAYGNNTVDKMQNDTLNIVLYLELNGFKKNERIEISITNSKGTKEIFNDFFNEKQSNSKIITTEILKNEVNMIEITSKSRKKNIEYGILIRKSNQAWSCISYDENGNLRVLFGDEFIGTD